MKVRQINEVIRSIVPLELALGWDNVGHLVGDTEKEVGSVLLTIDITGDVLKEAKRLGADMILSYHPVIWDGLKTVTDKGEGSKVFELIRADIAVFSVHTAMDMAIGGVNDGLAEMVGIVGGEPIGDYVSNGHEDKYKLVVFVPRGDLARVSNAMFAAGAGAIGNYRECCFMTEGVGSFRPLEGANPAIGEKGKLERVDEIRFEAIVTGDKLRGCIAAMKDAHSYEEPAYDCVAEWHDPQKYGLGRIGKLGKARKLSEIVESIKKATGASALGYIGKKERVVHTAAVCAGSCGKTINSVISQGADLYVTGEIKHHQALAAQEAGMSCICLSHTVSERFILKKLSKELQKKLKDIKISISKKDADPFEWKSI